jgi:phage terminase large subunit-like protein
VKALAADQRRELAAIVEELERRKRLPMKLADVIGGFYGWQHELTALTATKTEVCLCAGNQIGKTWWGTAVDAMHLTGEYPDDWTGHRFEHPPEVWALGYSMEKTRDLLQSKIFGKYINRQFEGGLVPREKILGHESAQGTPNAMRSVQVRHKAGIAVIKFWSYSQGQHALMGDVVDFFHIDEEPQDQSIRPQVLMRVANGDRGRGGRGIYTFTPENGRTELVVQFMDEPSKDQAFVMRGWDDAPHMTPEKRERMLELIPKHQRDMRSKGVPMLGHGRIFDLSDEFITCDAIQIPDHWYVIGGMDFGWDHPQAHVQLIEDRDAGDFYLKHSWKASQQSANDAWGAVKRWQEGVPVAWPQDGLQHEKGRDDAKQQRNHYEDAGFNMLGTYATWDSKSNSVEQGIYEIGDLMRKGKWKVFAGNSGYIDEFLQYHRDERGKIVKTRDDLLDAARYAYMMRRNAVPYGERKGRAFEPIEFTGWG